MSEKELELDGYQKKVARAATPHQVFAPTLRRAEAQAAKGVSLLIRKQDQLKEYADELRENGCGIGHVHDAWVKDIGDGVAQIHLANPVYMDSPPVAGSKIAIFEPNDVVKIYKVVDFRGVSIQFCICQLVQEIYLGEDIIEEEDVELEKLVEDVEFDLLDTYQEPLYDDEGKMVGEEEDVQLRITVELDEDDLAETTAIVEEDVERDGLADLVSLVNLVAMKPEDSTALKAIVEEYGGEGT